MNTTPKNYVIILPLKSDLQPIAHICIHYSSLTPHCSPKTLLSASLKLGKMEMSLMRTPSLVQLHSMLQATLIALHLSLRFTHTKTSDKKPFSPNVRLSGLLRGLRKRSNNFSIRLLTKLLFSEKTFLNSAMYRCGAHFKIDYTPKLWLLVGSLISTELRCMDLAFDLLKTIPLSITDSKDLQESNVVKTT